jgi:periplasmic protein TonB
MVNVQRSASLAAVLTLHVLACAALLSYAPARSALLAAAPIMVDLIAPPKIEPRSEPPVEIVPPKPRPKPKPVVKPLPKSLEPSPVVTAPVETPSPAVVAPPPEAPPPPPVAVAQPEPVPAPVVEVSPPIFNAAYLDNPQPRYPPLSRRTGEQGRVVLRVLVTPAGSAQQIEVRASSGHARLDDAACEAVRQWKFVPAKRGEQPVAAWVLIPVSFRLDG